MSEISSRVANLSPEQLAKLAYQLKASKASKAQEIPRRTAGEHCPLSFAQQRLWFISQLEPDDPSYNCIEALRMTGKLNVPLLEQTFNEVVRRHEALRTRFELVAGEPVQIVSSQIKLNPSLIDLRALPSSERERQISKLSSEAVRRPFDLTRAPLLRVVILRVSQHEHAILFTTHHIISDGWSLDVLVREIIELYAAFAEGGPSPLPELPLQYADFAIWQRQRLSGPVLEGHLDYWRQHLQDAPQVLALPTDRRRPAVLTRRGSSETVMLSPALTHSLRALSRREGVTLFMTMLGAFDVLLSRYSGQTDFLIGTDIANRNHGTTEPLIGFFVNQLVLRVDLAGDPTFNELLNRVKEVTLNGYAHQEVPFEKVVELLNPERNLSHAPLFQVKLVLQNAVTGYLELPELAIGSVEFERPVARFDLTLVISEEEDRISAEMEFSSDLFESSTIRRMLTQFKRLLASAVRDPGQHLSELELLDSATRHQLLVERNDTRIPYPHTRCIHELFEEQVAQSPDAIALTYRGEQVAYAELNTRANQLAQYLRAAGVKAETSVGICLNRSIDMVVAVFAILKAGGTYIPLDPQYPAERLACILDEVQPSIILTDSSLIDELPASSGQVLCLDTDQEWWSQLPETNLSDTKVSSENLAHVLYTSGSTGKPKGVAVPHRGVVRLVKQETYVTYGPDEVFLQMGSLSFDASTLEIFPALLTGGRLVLMPPGAPSIDDLAEVLTSEGVSKLWVTAGLFHPMVEHQVNALAGVRDVMAGGDVLSVEHVRRLLRAKAGNGSVINGYGPTESTVFTCCHRVSSEDELERGVPIGKPIANTQVYVLGEKMELLADGMVGELYIGGDGLARCYYKQPELTAERFVPHPFSAGGGERLYRTGDYVRWRADGLMEFVGRVDTQVKIRGYRIEPGEVEAVLGRHTSVSDCAVVARQEFDGEKQLVAYVVTKANGHSENTFELKEYLRERLPEFMIPAAVVAIESLPLTPNGKVDRRELATREVHVGSERSYTPPCTTTEEMLCEIWQEVLHAERVGIDDNFFDLGGDSILTIQVIVKARAVGLDLSVQQLFKYQTVQELAQELERSDESIGTSGETRPFSLVSEADRLRLPAGVVDAYPLTALQGGMLFHNELAPDAGHYHDILSFHLRMPFDGEALRATLQELIDLHPVLRTSFNLSDFSEPIQLVHAQVEAPIEIDDLRALSADEQEQACTKWMAAEKKRRFDWRNAPLLRFHIHRRADDAFQFSFSFHHAILDGWSVATMFTALFESYSAALKGDEHAGEASPGSSFRDFVAAERAILNSEEARQFWTTMLSDSTQTRLPRSDEAIGPARVVGRMVDISAELSAELMELARAAGVPLKSVLLAAHLRALSLLSGRDDVITGVVSHGRPETEDGERVLGLFLNSLPLRQKLSGGTWLQLVQETFQAERELLPFRRYPMARMQQDLGNDAPLFEVIFNYVHFHVYDEMQNVGGLEVLGYDGVADTEFTFAADFGLDHNAARVTLELNYNAGELSESQIEAAAGYYLTIFERMTRTPHERYEYQSLLSKGDRRKLLTQWNTPATPDLVHDCYQHFFAVQVARTPDALAAVLDGEQITYTELNRRSNQLAHYLQALGIGPETTVGVLLERSLDSIVALLAILKAGGVYVPLDPQQPAERLHYMIDDARLAVLITQTRFTEVTSSLPSSAQVIYLDSERQAVAKESVDDPVSGVSPANLAYVIYTSGSTGRPKGVAVSHEVLVSYCAEVQRQLELTPGDRVLAFYSFSFDASLEEVLPTLLIGASLVLRGEKLWTASDFVRTLAEEEISVINLPTAYWHKLTQDCVAADAFTSGFKLRLGVIGGEAVSSETVQLWQSTPMRDVRLLDAYGPTEAVVSATWFEVPAPLPETWSLPIIPIGRPLATRTAYILDSHGNLVPAGVPGELHLGGPVIARGYLNRPDLTAEKFIPDMFSDRPGARLYRTGDLARYLPDGNIEFLGRIDQQVKLRGFRIELGEIEAVLKQHESVREAVVITHEAQRLIAYVQLRAAGEIGASELRAYLKEKLPEYMVPGNFVEVAEFALTPNGKINRRALPAPESISAPQAEYEAPRTMTEELLSGLWASVLRLNRVGVNESFFELGGHSLLAIQLISRIRDAFGLELPLSDLFEHRTVSELAQRVESRLRASQDLLTLPLCPSPREDALPLSFAQQRLWFLDQLIPESIAYNMAEALRLRGPLNVAALEQSVNEIMRRHEAVRTSFPEVDGNPIQHIAPFRHLALPVVDLGLLSGDDREIQAVRLAAAEAQRPFDLQSGPLLRTALLRLGQEDHVLLFTMHHIISDGWSTGLLANEVAVLYDAFATGNASPLPELAIQYADFAVWQRQWLSGDVLARQLDYWTNKLQGAPPLIALPTDFPRPKVQLTEGAFATHLLGAELTSDLKSLTQQAGATLYMTMMAAFHVLLHRYARQATIVTGTPVANRTRIETEPLIGFFVNTLVLRSDFDDDPTFLTHLSRLRKHALEAYAHQDLPFEMVVDQLQLGRDLSYNPLFQVMFSWEEADLNELSLKGLDVGPVGVDNRTSLFDLTLRVTEAEGGKLRCSMQYNTALFAEETINRMLGHYEELLLSVVRDPRRHVSRLPLLSGEERRQLLREWNETAAPYETGVTLAELFERQVARDSAAVAVVTGGREVTYGELNERANRVARYLREDGVGADARVGLLVDRGLEMVVGLLGIVKAGAAYVPLDPGYPRARLEYMIADAAVSVLLTERRQHQLATEVAASVETMLYLDDLWTETGLGANLEETVVDPDNLAYIIYTSGSTGQPKGVMNTHRGICNLLSWKQDAYRLTAGDRLLQKTSFSFDVSVWELFWPLVTGARLVMAEPGGHQNPAYLRQVIEQEQITIIHFVPAMLQVFLDEPGLEQLASLRKVLCGGDAFSFELQERCFSRLNVELYNRYGPTETAVVAAHWKCERNSARKMVPIGKPIANTQVYLLDQDYEPVPIGVAGELHIGGAGLARGYFGKPGLTAEKFIPNPFSSEPGARLYKTGDVARYLADGNIEFLGRVDQQVKVRGFRIELGEIEVVLNQHPSVREAVVVMRAIAPGEQRLIAYVQLSEAARADVGELRVYLKERLPEYMVPSTFVEVAEFPLTASGKINRHALPAPDATGVEDNYHAPRTQTEELLTGLFAGVLRVQRVGVHDNFFELGGHSLLATQLVSRVREAFGVELPLRELFERPTVAGLAEQVQAELSGGVQVADALPLVAVSRAQDLPLSSAQQRLWFLDQLEPGSVAYNIPAAVRLSGRLDLEALERTLNEVVRRHEILRTRFEAVNGEPVQVISPPRRLDLPVMDLSALPEDDREAEARRLAAAEAQQPFALSVGPLLRVQVLRLSEEEHVVLFTMHHIISDGWSTGVLLREVAALYDAYIKGQGSPLAELEIQYADYAVWQREWMQGEVLEQQLDYWRRQLGEDLPVLELPTDKQRPPIQSHRGRALNFNMPAQLAAELKKLSNSKGVTLFMTLLAVFKILLWRYSGQSDVVIGTPIAGRNHLATEGLIGLFVNTLVLRTSLSGNPSFGELLERIREVTLGAYAHQDLPFETLVEELQPKRDMSRSPLFQVMFVLQNAPATMLRLPALESSDISIADETAKFDLTLGLTETGDELHGWLEYSTDLFDDSTIERLARHYELLLEAVAADPDRLLSQLPLLLEEDQHKLLAEWNDTRVAYDLEKCMHQLFEAQVRRTPDAVAVSAGDSRLTYSDLERRAETLAKRLRQAGVGPEQRVGILVRRNAAMVVAALGVLKAGGAYVPLDAEYPLERLSLMADDAQLSALVAEGGLETEFVRPGLKLVLLNGATGECIDDASERESKDELPAVKVSPENLAYVIYTSGSTGRPKGVAITHRSAVAFINWARQVFPPSSLAGVLASTSLSFDLSVFELFVTLSCGGKIILADNALQLPALESAQQVTLINTVPSAMTELLRIGAVPDCVEVINLAGEALPGSLVQQIYEKTKARQVWNLYGPSEDTTYSTSALIEKNQPGPVVIGRPVTNTQAYICDESLQLMPVGVAGQLLLAGDGLARGYMGRPDLTAERFLPNPFGSDSGTRLYLTGDLARYRADGQLEFLGRADSQVKLRGFRIEPGEIETVLREHPSVRDAIVIATTTDDKRLVAYVVTAESGTSVSDLRDYLRARLPEYMVPSAFVLLEAFPLTPNGKIDRRALPLPDQSTTTSDSALTTPRDVLELQLIQIWKEVLRRDQIGLTDNFFDLGGHSLLAVRLINSVERLVGQKLPLSIMFQGATIEQLAATLRRRVGKLREQSLVCIQPHGSRPPLFLVHPASGNVMSYVALARRLGTEQPVYGLQSRGLDPDRKPTARVEDMASEYLQELIGVQPEGPYFLGGWSMGGVVAFEMARQLTAQGKTVATLILFDSYIQTARSERELLDEATLREYFLEEATEFNQHLFELFKVNVHAAQRYAPRKCAQEVILFQAAETSPQQAAESLKRWEKVAERVVAHQVPGTHHTLFSEPNVGTLADHLHDLR